MGSATVEVGLAAGVGSACTCTHVCIHVNKLNVTNPHCHSSLGAQSGKKVLYTGNRVHFLFPGLL